MTIQFRFKSTYARDVYGASTGLNDGDIATTGTFPYAVAITAGGTSTTTKGNGDMASLHTMYFTAFATAHPTITGTLAYTSNPPGTPDCILSGSMTLGPTPTTVTG